MTGSVLYDAGEEITEATLRRSHGRVGNSDYVQSGLAFTPDFDASPPVLDVSQGIAFVLDNNRDYPTFPDAAAGLELPTDGIAHIYLVYDESVTPAEERVYYEIAQPDTAPSVPSLKVGTVDIDNESHTELNRTPPVNDEDATTLKGNDIDSDGDGSVDAADRAAVADRTDALGPADDTVAKSDVLLRDGSASLQGDLSIDHNTLAAIGRSVWEGANGDRGMRASVRDTDGDSTPDKYYLTPIDNGNVLSGNALRYDYAGGRWITGGGGHRVTGAAGSLDISAAGANRARFLPVQGGTRLFDKEFFYDYDDENWQFQPPVVFGAEQGGSLIANVTGGLARFTPTTGSGGPRFDDELTYDFETNQWGADTLFDALARAADALTPAARGQQARRSPNEGFAQTTIPAGEDVRKVVYVPAGERLWLWVWGVIDSAGNTPSGLDLALYNLAGGGEVGRTGSKRAVSGSGPILKTDVGGDFQFRLENNTATERDASASIGYSFEEDGA